MIELIKDEEEEILNAGLTPCSHTTTTWDSWLVLTPGRVLKQLTDPKLYIHNKSFAKTRQITFLIHTS